jgi:hypothetical protein
MAFLISSPTGFAEMTLSTQENMFSDQVEIAHLDALISGADYQIQRQREVITQLRSSGEPTDDAEKTLEVMIGIVERLRRYRAVIRRLSTRRFH